MEPRNSCTLNMCFTTELYPPPSWSLKWDSWHLSAKVMVRVQWMWSCVPGVSGGAWHRHGCGYFLIPFATWSVSACPTRIARVFVHSWHDGFRANVPGRGGCDPPGQMVPRWWVGGSGAAAREPIPRCFVCVRAAAASSLVLWWMSPGPLLGMRTKTEFSSLRRGWRSWKAKAGVGLDRANEVSSREGDTRGRS